MIAPAYALDFLGGTLAPSITFARAGAMATRVNSSGLVESVAADTPRFDYAPVTLAARGLLIEETRQNICLQSQNIGTTWTVANGSTSTDVAISPDGTQNADKAIWNTVNGLHWVTQTFTTVASTVYTVSVFLKEAGSTRANIMMVLGGPSFLAIGVNLATGTITTNTAAAPQASVSSIQNFGNGWYRVSMQFTANSTSSSLRITGSSTTSWSFTGNNVDGIYIWGAQLEAGAFPTSYIPTTTAAVTRNADVATITGTNFSDWWQASKGGVLVRARPGTVSGTRPWIQFDDGTANEIIALRGNATNPELYIVDGGTPQAQIDAGTIAANTDYSLTGWWATNDCKARLDSGAVVTDTSATIPTVTQARLGSDGTNYLNGHLASISYYDSFSEQIYTRRKNKAVFNLM